MTGKAFVRWFAVFVAFGLLSACGAKADNLYATIRGTVTDESGAAIAGATVTATNVGTGIVSTVTSGSDGSYQFVQLPVGSYIVKAAKQGFSSFVTSPITLQLDQVYVQAVKLDVGKVSQTVTVEANANQVNTTTMQLGTVITSQQIEEMPLINRNWVQLQQLEPGVESSSDRFTSNYATNGSQTQQNSFLVNGADTNDIPLNTPIVTPSLDAISQFNMVTNTINPEYGRNSGAILNATVKSGTNQFHGDGFEFYRDSFMNSTAWFKPAPAIFHEHFFGGTVGGPVWKDHTFFFFSYEGRRFREPQTGFATPLVPDSNMRTGQLGAGVITQACQDNSGNAIYCSSPSAMVGEDGNTYPAGTPYNVLFPTGTIPSADLDPIAQKLLSTYVPLPNSGNEYQYNAVTSGSLNQYIVRGDHTFNPANNISFYALWQQQPSADTLGFPPNGSDLPGFGDTSSSATKQYVLTYNHSFSPTMLNEFRVGYTRFNFQDLYPAQVIDPSSLGFNINPQSPLSSVPYIGITGANSGVNFSLGFTYQGPQPRKDQTYQLTDNFSILHGNHAFKMGFAGRDFRVANPFFFVNNGYFDFSGEFSSYTTGDGFADFLLGVPDQYEQTSGGYIDATATEYYGYFQDEWKIRPNFTLTYGAGYQYDSALKDHFNNNNSINCFVPGHQSTVYPTAPLGLNFVGDSGCPLGGYTPGKGNIGPRVGFAWSPGRGGFLTGGSGNSSIRGGFGVYYNRTEEEVTLQNLLAFPFSQTDFGIGDFGLTPSFDDPYCDVAGSGCITNRFPYTPPAPGSSVDFTPSEPLGIVSQAANFRMPSAMNYNLTFERQLPSAAVLTLSYVGAQGRHLEDTIELNPSIDPAACAADPACVANRAFQPILYPSHYRYDGSEFGSIGELATDGVSHYNSFQASVRKTTTHGLSFTASYTWSHSIDTGSSYENADDRNFNLPLSYDLGDSAFDARQRLVIGWVYDIWTPAAVRSNLILDRVLGGWELAGIGTFQTGFPVNISDGADLSLTCSAQYTKFGCPDRPDYSGTAVAIYSDPRTAPQNASKLPEWFNPAGFVHPAEGTFGNVRRNPLHGPGINNWDISLAKNLKISESKSFQLRLQASNAFNHAQFNNPSADLQSLSTFGTIRSARDPRQAQLGVKFNF